jgi:ClpP class serine protease
MQSLEALQTVQGSRMEGTRHVRLYDNGVAVIDLIGPIFPRANMMTMSSGMSISQFTNDFVKAEAHADVRGIVINADSPGGDVRGIGDAARIVNLVSKKSKKPIQCFVNGFLASAAYYVGSAVGPGNIISTESGIIGSIGVVLNAERKGKDEIVITSSQSPYKRPDPESEKGREIMQQQVDDLAEIFVRDVAKYRNVSPSKVLTDYGQGTTLVGPRALKQGLVDRIDTLSGVVEKMAAGSKGSGRNFYNALDGTNIESMLNFNQEDDNTMSSLKDMIARFGASNGTVLDSDIDEQAQTPIVDAETDDASVVAETGTEPPVADAGITPPTLTREELEERFSDSAELFATQTMMENKVYPAYAAHVASDLLTARIDDTLYGGTVSFVNSEGQLTEGTREEQTRARYKAMPKHTMTQAAIPGIKAGTVKASVLAESDKTDEKDDSEPITEARRKELLGTSVQGQAVLKTAQR